MNENVTNKTPKRRRWIARLLVSALCILLVSSLLFVSVVADNVNSFSLDPWNINTIGEYPRYTLGYWIDSSDSDMGYIRVGVLPDRSTLLVEAFSSYDVLVKSFTYITSYQNLYDVTGCSSFGNYIAVCVTVGDGGSSSLSYILGFNWNATLLDTYNFGGRASPSNLFFNGTEFGFTGSVTPPGETSSSSRYFLGDVDLDGAGNYALLYDASFRSWFFVTNAYYFNVFSHAIVYQSQASLNSYLPTRVYSGKSTFYRARTSLFGDQTSLFLSFDDGIRSSVSASGVSFSFPLATNSYVLVLSPGAFVSPSFSSSVVGVSLTRASGTSGSDPYLVYATSSEYVPPESSDETTTDPPPESSEPDDRGMLNIYRTDIDRSGGVMVFNSTLDTSIPSDGLESLSAYLGYYWDVDSSVQPPPSYMYLLASYEDGTRQRYDFDFSAYGYALGSDFAQNFYYPDYLGMEFEIPLNGETDIYFVTSSPGGSVTVENSDGRIITLNFGSTSSYARIDFVDELNYRITLYNNDMAIGNSLTFDQGVYRYLFVYNVDSAVNTWYYPEPGTFTLINYDKVENGLYNVVLTLNDKIPDYGKPGDFENAVSRYEEIEGVVSSTMSETWEYLESLQEELNASFDIVEFSEANAKLDQILSTPGGDTIFTFFKSLWGINPLLPTFAVMTVCFAGVAFIIRKI